MSSAPLKDVRAMSREEYATARRQELAAPDPALARQHEAALEKVRSMGDPREMDVATYETARRLITKGY